MLQTFANDINSVSIETNFCFCVWKPASVNIDSEVIYHLMGFGVNVASDFKKSLINTIKYWFWFCLAHMAKVYSQIKKSIFFKSGITKNIFGNKLNSFFLQRAGLFI